MPACESKLVSRCSRKATVAKTVFVPGKRASGIFECTFLASVPIGGTDVTVGVTIAGGGVITGVQSQKCSC